MDSAIFTSRRKKFNLNLPITDRQLWAIGVVVVEWTQIENWIVTYAHALIQDDKKAWVEFDGTQVMKYRVQQLKTLISTRVIEPFRTDFLTVVERVLEIKQERDRIIHGSWMNKNNPDNTPKTEEFADRLVGTSKPGSPFQWKLDYGGIMEVARKIDVLNQDFMLIFGRIVHPLPQGVEGIMLDVALQRILYKQYHAPAGFYPEIPPKREPQPIS